MDTALLYDLHDRQLTFRLREHVLGPKTVQLKGKAHFNTVTSKINVVGTVKGHLLVGEQSPDAGTRPLVLGAGLFMQGTDVVKSLPKPLLHVSAKKVVSLINGPQTVASAKAYVNFDPQSGEVVARKASIKVALKWLSFTKRQDLKLSTGLDVDFAPGATKPDAVPFAQVRENNWALNYRQKRWFVTYDL